jgi:hypothetical protein
MLEQATGWVEWAEAYAEKIDPLARIPTVPDAPEPSHDQLRPFLRELGVRDPLWG